MQNRPRVCTQSYNIASIRRNLRLKQYNMDQLAPDFLSSSAVLFSI